MYHPLQEVWNNKKPNIKNIKKAASNFNWNKSFKNISTDEKVELLSKTFENIFRNYIPNKKCKCDYRQLPWMTHKTKKSLSQRETDHETVFQILKVCKMYLENSKKS